MKGIAFYFFAIGVLAVVLGMVWGIQMSASGNHTLSPAHAHLNLLGFVAFSIFGFYYHLVPAAAEGLLPRLHLGSAVAGLVLIVPGIVMAISGSGETFAKLGSVLTLLSMILFLVVVLRQGRQASAVPAE